MTGFERTAAHLGLAALTVSSTHALMRRREEVRRRTASPLVQLLPDGAGGQVECSLIAPEVAERPIVVFETGLGAPFESWDWLVQLLTGDYWLLRYHRRGLGRTRTRQRPGALVTRLLEHPDLADLPDQPVHLVGHSLGGLVLANNLLESPRLADRTVSATMIDTTDAELLHAERQERSKVRQFRQYCFQEGLAAVTGVGRWTANPVETEVNFRATTQRAFLTESSRPRTLRTAVREHAHEPLDGQRHLAGLPITKTVVAAADNVIQQRRLAERLGADLVVVPGSSHRSIIGRYAPATRVAATIREVAR